MRYEDAYAKAYPFDKMVDGMMQDEMVMEAIAINKVAAEKATTMDVIINNRAGGNAPLIAREFVNKYIGSQALNLLVYNFKVEADLSSLMNYF
jgi:hypothetical protein